MSTSAHHTEQQMALWRATLGRRSVEAERDAAARRSRAMDFAVRAAEVLRSEFGAQSVILFGSLAHGRWYSEWSDVDLAATGLDHESHLIAIARLSELAGDLEFDLVRMETCSAALRATLDTEGEHL